jgi:hypothetical protein
MHTKKQFKQKVEWFIANKHKMSQTRREWYLEAMEERYEHFISYEKYGYYGEGIVAYINDTIRKKMKAKS